VTATAELLEAARARLRGAPREALGVYREPRRLLGIARAPRIERHGAAWHLGVLLLADAEVYATGEIIRARGEARRGFAAESQRQRAELAAAARRGGFAEGETVHIGWRALDVHAVDRGETSGPLAVVAGVPSVRWSAAGGFVPLAGYLDERVSLLREPPAGA
jgi:hypothetical protein